MLIFSGGIERDLSSKAWNINTMKCKHRFCGSTKNEWVFKYECNGIRTHNHFVRKRTFNHLAKLAKLAKLASLAKWLSDIAFIKPQETEI